ncbi:hypothetical protein KR044_009163 [Drosophila immigrans]|nr:hypothetical protein KR044_009163 [Drosophila immigrans]
MNIPEWQTIPTLVLEQIFDFLDSRDRRAAANCCWAWRQHFFQRRYFRNFRFHIDVAQDDQLTFFHRSMANLAKELVIVFDFHNAFHIQKIRGLLYKAARCDNIRALRFQTNNVGSIPPGNAHSDQLVAIEQCFVEPLKMFLSRKNQACQVLDLGAIEALTYYGYDLLKAMGKPQELLQLTLASIKYDPNHYPILELDTTLLQKCASLQVLSLDYDTLSDELLHTIQVLPLRKLLIVVHGLDRDEHAGVSDAAWANFSMHFTQIELVLTLVYAYEAVELLVNRIVGDHMPVTHIRILFCEYMSHDAIDGLSMANSDTLRSIYYIDSGNNRGHSNYLSNIRGQDAFVMLAWRCKQLEEIVVHGHPMDPHNLLGIARLRSRQLRRVEVSQINWPNGEPQYAFNDEMCKLLGQRWTLLKYDQLPAALDYGPVDYDERNEFVYELLRRDLQIH